MLIRTGSELHSDDRYHEAPESLEGHDFSQSVFLAGIITGSEEWQPQFAKRVLNREDLGLSVWNPRRANFPMDDPSAAADQIAWEFQAISRCASVSFWFGSESMCPICLYELGKCSMIPKPLFVGVDPDYQRLQDVCIQTALIRPEVRVVPSLDGLLVEIASYWKQRNSS